MVHAFVQGNSCQSSGQQHKPIVKSYSIGSPANILDSPGHDVFNNGTLWCSDNVIATSYSLVQNEAMWFLLFSIPYYTNVYAQGVCHLSYYSEFDKIH